MRNLLGSGSATMGSVYARSNFRRCLSQYPSAALGGREFAMAAAAAPQNGVVESAALRESRPLAWLPRHSVTRRTAKITREVQCLWNAKLGPAATVVPVDKIEPLFNDLQIFPTRAQIDEMLRCAQRSAGRNSTKYLTFPEFCIFATGLKHSLHNKRLDPNFFRRLLQKDGREKIKTRRMSSIPHPEVFLGGSCNPTTWRQDEAIPILRNSGVTFFNPQVSDWSPELMELEHEAKQNAQILLYVLDSQTRNVVSLVETAYFLGKKRKIVIVMNLFQEAGHEIACEKITSNEFNDLNSSSSLLKQLMERQKVAVFANVREALRYANEVLKERNKETDEKTKMKEAFESLDIEKCGQISPNDVSEAIRLFMQKRNQSDEMQKNILQKIDSYNKLNSKNGKVDFEQFCQIVSKLNLNIDKSYLNGRVEKRPNFTPDLFRSLSTPDDKPTFVASNGICVSDIYLGGDCDQRENWRQRIVIPEIKNACLTFYNPENERPINKKLSPSEFAAINNAHVKLFVITSTSRSLFPMVLASYFIGIGANVVLCIQYLPDKCVIGSDELSHNAVKDYNRGRHYLADIARRENVPIFESISDAVQAAINKCIR